MKVNYTLRGYLSIRGLDGSPETVSTVLGLEPDEIRHDGEIINQIADIRRKGWAWELHSPISPDNTDMDDVVKSIVTRVRPVIERFADLPSHSISRSLRIVVELRSDVAVPAISLLSEHVRFLAEIGADLDVDLYAYKIVVDVTEED